MSPAGSSNAPEARARARIDQALTDAGWTLQDRDDMNLAAAPAIAVREFKLDKGAWNDEQLINLMIMHPILINRPIVETPLGVRLCRPSELVLEILPNSDIGPFTKEDGQVIEFPRKPKRP